MSHYGEKFFDIDEVNKPRKPKIRLRKVLLLLLSFSLSFLAGSIIAWVFYPTFKNWIKLAPVEIKVIEHRLALLKVGKAIFDGEKTLATHMFKAIPNEVYRLEYSTELGGSWENGEQHHTTEDGVFYATLIKKGNHLKDWEQKMFFRLVHVTQPENPLLAQHN